MGLRAPYSPLLALKSFSLNFHVPFQNPKMDQFQLNLLKAFQDP